MNSNQPAQPDILSDEPKFQAMCKAIFDEMDKDKSGSIDTKELEQALQKASKTNGLPSPSKQEIQDAVKLFDKNKDGTIQLKEFIEVTREAYRKAKSAAPPKEEAKGGAPQKLSLEERIYNAFVTSTFEIMDKDKNGFIVPAELGKGLEEFALQAKCPPPQKGQVQKLFEKYDKNKDQKFDLNEFLKVAKDIFNIEVVPDKPEENKSEPPVELDEKTKKRLMDAHEYERYIEETGLAMSFKIIFAEILSKKIPEDAVFAYTAARLRQIGEDIAFIQNSKYKKEF